MFGVGNEGTRTMTPLASFWCLYYPLCALLSTLARCSGVSVVDFGQVNAGWASKSYMIVMQFGKTIV